MHSSSICALCRSAAGGWAERCQHGPCRLGLWANCVLALLHFATCTLRDRFATSMVAKMSAPAALVKRSAQTALEVCVCGNQP